MYVSVYVWTFKEHIFRNPSRALSEGSSSATVTQTGRWPAHWIYSRCCYIVQSYKHENYDKLADEIGNIRRGLCLKVRACVLRLT